MVQKKVFFIGLLLICNLAFSQHRISYNIGYLGHFAVQPGMTAGVSIIVKDLSTNNDSKQRINSLMVHPSIGWFSRINYNRNALLGTDFGIRSKRVEKGKYSTYSLGINYLQQSEILLTQVNLKGEVVFKEFEQRHYFLPTMGYTFGRDYESGIGWYCKLSGGMKFAQSYENIAMAFVSVGLNINGTRDEKK